MKSIFHLRTQGFRSSHLIELLGQAHADGFDEVNIHWERFPHSFETEPAYSLEEVRAIDAACEKLGFDVIAASHSFSHSDDILRLPSFSHLRSGGDSMELTGRTVDIMLLVAKELKEAHPRMRFVHLGGDEITTFASSPAENRYAVERGRSALYIDFVNQLAIGLGKLGLRLALWSDMLIRFPEKATELDRSVLIFYWDYWGEGERSPFVSIGGGLSDIFILNRSALRGDLQKLLFSWLAREKCEIPLGHWRRFAPYWELDSEETSARSFPYSEWFRTMGFEHVSCLLPIPEKGSFLPPVAQKLDHMRGFIRRGKSAGGSGWMACSWGDFWPPLVMFRPGLLVALSIAGDLDADGEAIYANAAQRLGSPWTKAALKGWCEAGAHIEFADILDNNWGKLPMAGRLEWLEEAGWLAGDLDRAETIAARCETLLANAMAGFPLDGWERFAIEDMAWRCRLEIACHHRERDQLRQLIDQGRLLRKRATRLFARWWPDAALKTQIAKRYDQWEQAAAQAVAFTSTDNG